MVIVMVMELIHILMEGIIKEIGSKELSKEKVNKKDHGELS